MKIDFLRHIVNPILEKHVESRSITARDMLEIRKMIFAAEGKYQFSVYNGDVLNLINYFRSRDFDELLSYISSIGAIKVIIEILEKTAEVYNEHREIRETISRLLDKYVLGEKPKHEELTSSMKPRINVEEVVNIAKDIFSQSRIEVLGNGVRIIPSEDVELRVTLLKQRFKIEFKFKGEMDGSRIKRILLEARSIAEKTSNI
ncbi:MAG: hypothetical protein QXE81_05415 [Desulfurococcaceae archaeon]